MLPEGAVGMRSMFTIDIFGNLKIPKNARKVRCSMRIVYNSGTTMVNHMATLLIPFLKFLSSQPKRNRNDRNYSN